MSTAGPRVEVLWRPGCRFCTRLRAGLRRAGISTIEHDIWADPRAAARVRAITGGAETVPTVVVGERALVNPSVRQVIAAVGEVYPQHTDTPAGSATDAVAGWTDTGSAARLVCRRQHLRRTSATALVVGSVLFMINHLDTVLAGAATTATWVKIAVTYLVPFTVANIGLLLGTRRPAAHRNADTADDQATPEDPATLAPPDGSSMEGQLP